MRETVGMALFLVALTMARCGASNGVSSSSMPSESTSARKQESWSIEITTDGGLTGKGLGSVTIDSRGHVGAADLSRRCDGSLTTTESAALTTGVASATPGSWKTSYADPATPHGHPDEIHYSLSLARGGESYATAWYGEQGSALPADLITLRDAAWQVRSRVVATCK